MKIKRTLQKMMAVGMLVVILIAAGDMTVSAASGGKDFEFFFSGEGGYAWTDMRQKDTMEFLSMKCTYSEIPDAYYGAWSFGNGSAYSRQVYFFWQDSWHTIDYFGPTGINVGIEAQLVNDGGIGEQIFEGYWYVDSGISQ